MGFSSIWHWLIVLLIVLLLFGAGKLPRVMGDLAKGIKNFKSGLKDEDDETPQGRRRVEADGATPVSSAASTKAETAAKRQERRRGGKESVSEGRSWGQARN